MKNIYIRVPKVAVRFLLNHNTFDRVPEKSYPKVSVSWREKNNILHTSVLTFDDFFTFACMCKFPSAKQKIDFLEDYIPSLRRPVRVESNNINYKYVVE